MRKKTRCFTDGAENARNGGVAPCGAAAVTQKEIPGKAKKNGFALWGFILSLLQVVPGSYISYLSLALSLLALRRCVEHPEQYTGKRFAVAGVCFSVLGIVLFFILAAYGIYLLRLRMQGFLS